VNRLKRKAAPESGLVLDGLLSGADGEPELEHLFLTGSQGAEHGVHERLGSGIVDRIGQAVAGVLHEVTEHGVTILGTHLTIEGIAGADVLPQASNLVLGKLQKGSDLSRGRTLTVHLTDEPSGGLELAHDLVDVNRDPDRARLVLEGTTDGLTDPVNGIGGEAVPTVTIELLDSGHETDVTLLNEIDVRHAELGSTATVLLRHVDHQPEVGLDHGLTSLLGLGVFGVLGDGSEGDLILTGEEVSGEESEVGVGSGLRHRHILILP